MEFAKIKQKLLDNKKALEERLERTHKHIYHKDEAVSANFHEQVVQTENDQLVHTLDNEAQAELRQINQALQRIDDGTYQECSKCGKAIAEARLEAIPYTSTCIDCA